MKKINLFLLIQTFAIATIYSAKAYDYNADLLGFNNKLYLSDGSYLYMEHSQTSSGLSYTLYKYNPTTGKKTQQVRKSFNILVEGVDVNKDTIRQGQNISNRNPVLIFDENGNYRAYYNGGSRRNYVDYSEEGKLLRYQNDDSLFEAFNNMFECELHAYLRDYYPEVSALNDISEDGNYYERDSHGNLMSIYHRNGEIEKLYSYKYNSNGSYTQYDKNGNLLGTYNSDGSAYIPKRIYTVEEATEAAKGNKNTFSIRYR